SELTQALENPCFQIMPLVLRPTETGASFAMRPLCTYDGYEREIAFKEIVAVMEKILRDTLHIEPRKTALDHLLYAPTTIQPIIASQSPTKDLIINAIQPIHQMIERLAAQVVEARQDEQKTYQALESQLAEVCQQIAAPKGWLSSLRRK
ncbi:MAG: hypothetical protein ACRDHW_08705, partial [Ktedonobacteraceae bacterium]